MKDINKKEVNTTIKTICSYCGFDISKNEKIEDRFVCCFNCNRFTAKGANNYKLNKETKNEKK